MEEYLTVPFIVSGNPEKSFELKVDVTEEDEITLFQLKLQAQLKLNDSNLEITNIKLQDCEEIDLSKAVSYYKYVFPFFLEIKKKGEIKRDREASVISSPDAPVFADVTNNKGIKEINFCKKAPDWRICCRGCNIFGRCTNPDCETNKSKITNQIIYRVGFKIFDLQIDSAECVCPMCKKWVQPETCGFYKCKYRFAGCKKVQDKKPEKFYEKKFHNASTTSLTYYDPKESGSCIWTQFKILTKPLDDEKNTSFSSTNVSTFRNECALCKKTIEKEEYQVLDCDHLFHKSCYTNIKISQVKYNGCPICNN